VFWKIYYDDLSTFSSDDGPPSEAPARGVLIVVQEIEMPDGLTDRGTLRVDPENDPLEGFDYFCFRYREGRWYNCNFQGLLDYFGMGGLMTVLQGRMVAPDIWDRVWKKMKADPDIPRRKGY
jgi:hypothetical protein